MKKFKVTLPNGKEKTIEANGFNIIGDSLVFYRENEHVNPFRDNTVAFGVGSWESVDEEGAEEQ